jgi:hypothetical protein
MLSAYPPVEVASPDRFQPCGGFLHTSEATEAGSIRSFLSGEACGFLGVDDGARLASLAIEHGEFAGDAFGYQSTRRVTFGIA